MHDIQQAQQDIINLAQQLVAPHWRRSMPTVARIMRQNAMMTEPNAAVPMWRRPNSPNAEASGVGPICPFTKYQSATAPMTVKSAEAWTNETIQKTPAKDHTRMIIFIGGQGEHLKKMFFLKKYNENNTNFLHVA